jgi:hypothetical protein
MKAIKIFIISHLLILHSISWSGTSQGLVSNLFIHTPGVLMFKAGSINGTPPCNTNNQWAISLSTTEGKPFLALLLSAQAQGKQVYVQGYTNSCRDWGDRELPSYIVLID